jgi:hypothetical protein
MKKGPSGSMGKLDGLPNNSYKPITNTSTRRKPPTLGSQLVNFITCGCDWSALFFYNLQNRAGIQAVLVIGLYELLGNPSNLPIEPLYRKITMKRSLAFSWVVPFTSVDKRYIWEYVSFLCYLVYIIIYP